MKKFFIYTLLVASFFTTKFSAQNYSKRDILKKIKAKDLIKGNYFQEEALIAKMKSTKKWGLYSIYYGLDIEELEIKEIIPPKFDSLSFFKWENQFQIVKQKNKYGILLSPSEVPDAITRVNCKYEKLLHKKVNDRDFVLFKENEKWGLIDWFDEFIIVDPIFDNPEEVPLIWMESWAVDTFKRAKTKLNADLIVFDPNNGDGVLKARNKKNKKWGLYQFLYEEYKEIIPTKYDSINFFPFNAKYTAVYNSGKVGFYISKWSYKDDAKQTVECKYDDYKRFNDNGISKLAVKRNGKWGWIDWLTGKEKSEFKYNTPDDLPYPYYKQNYWLDEN